MSISEAGTVNGTAVRPVDGRKENGNGPYASMNRRGVPTTALKHAVPRAASYTNVGNAKFADYGNSFLMKESLEEAEEEEGYGRDDDFTDTTPPDTSGVNTPDENYPEMELRAPRLRAIVAELQKSSDVQVQSVPESQEDEKSSITSSLRDHSSSVDSIKTESTVASTVPTTPRARSSIASNFSRKIYRRSWISSAPTTPSRSPSPSKSTPTRYAESDHSPAIAEPERAFTKRRKSFVKRKDSLKASKAQAQSKEQQSEDDRERSISRKNTTIKKKPRPLSNLFKGQMVDENKTPTEPTRGRRLVSSSSVADHDIPATYKPQRPPVPSLPKSFSTDKLPSIRSGMPAQHRAAPMPRLLSPTEKPPGFMQPKKKDELWSTFRMLDGDFTKFASKSLAFKANVVRSSLLPFLRQYATHSSNKTLRPEDLDRRANILNKWWTGLIEMLHGRNNQSISGTDRPAILDGIAGIMERPEWRLSPSPFCPLNQRSKAPPTPRNQSSTSVLSNSSDFLADSVHHNVRNIFIQNLSAQMAFVVDKMSLRNASASLVTFCGKACAYAFVFVPGMADVLGRLWELQMDVLRRVLDGNDIGKFDSLTGVAQGIVSSYPPALQQLGFTSLMKYMRKLRTPPPLPLGTANVQWWGHWLERWSGRESDLFYVFVKYFHILATDFLPTDASKQERMCAPGFLLVHAQVLTNLDATIHRDTSRSTPDPTTSASSPTFDDVLTDPDAVASALPLAPNNATRLMAENRLIMLIRDFLSERAAEHPIARRVFAESFNVLLQTAARGTSMYNHFACYTLLDFLEEALHLLIRFEKMEGSKMSLIDLDFWMLVWRKMIESHNTMTEVRLYAFLYTVWNTVICELGWKHEVCNDLLLDRQIFESRFNHWCPMVRAYFMRLLCWRVGRYDGEPAPGSVTILETFLERLRTTWSYYLFLREQAAQHDMLAPSTSPCNPAPTRRLLIIRTDPQVSTPAAFLSFDGLLAPKTPTDTTSKRMSTMSTISALSTPIPLDPRPDSSMSTLSSFSDLSPEPRGRGIGGFLKHLVSSKSRSKSHGRATPPKPLPTDSMPIPDRRGPGLGITRSATSDLTPASLHASTSHIQLPQPHRTFTFKFSLEYTPHAKPHPPLRLLPPRLPLPAQQLLQTFSTIANANASLSQARRPEGGSVAHARYCGRALAEWAVVVGECQGFFERREREGMERGWVETPGLGVEVFRRPG
ncbi:hypothetical protein LTR09_012023 [Extremus antarcticus]|uniref:DUF1765-domain-containing protein n=1 Tax=Extremus antarcticus TaxID=702011 RepID=A0AAJ0G749_9PEZI|nr:hypothetical protein LTR09_012023 [Extremus antarcticus]